MYFFVITDTLDQDYTHVFHFYLEKKIFHAEMPVIVTALRLLES